MTTSGKDRKENNQERPGGTSAYKATLFINLGSGYIGAIDRMPVTPTPLSNLYAEVLFPNLMASGSSPFGRLLGHEGGAFMNAIITQERPSFSPPFEDTPRRQPSANQEEVPHREMNWPAPWDFLASRTLRNKFLLFKPPSPRYFVIAARTDKDNRYIQYVIIHRTVMLMVLSFLYVCSTEWKEGRKIFFFTSLKNNQPTKPPTSDSSS